MPQAPEGRAKAEDQIKNAKAEVKPDINPEKKKGKGILKSIFLVLIIIVLTGIIAFGAIYVFNFGGIGLKRSVSKLLVNVPVVGKMVTPIAENKTPQQLEQEKINSQKTTIEAQLKDIAAKQKLLEEKEQQLNQKEADLKVKETDLNNREVVLSDKIQNIQEQVQYLEKMDSQKAVQILLNMEKKETVVQILRNMKKDKAIALISLMDPLQAAQLLEDLAAQPAATQQTEVPKQ